MLDAFHIVKLAGDAPGEVRRRVQQDTTGHRGRKGDPLYLVRNLLRASRHKLTPCQQERVREAPSGAVCPAAPGCTGCFTYPVLRDTRAAHAGSYR
ncbi:transposase [uncultured Actinomyces sp.]|uniref:transposase n=1 Tax=uncultured Actinomyces sp. TaxID=249061 RepID=UPI0037DCC66D